jgi:hypothetical protein
MDRAGFAGWLDAYRDAWRSNDRAQIEALFSDDAQYRYSPYGEPEVGAKKIADSWLDEPDAPDSWDAEYRPLAIDGDTFVAIGESRYPGQGKAYSNIFVCKFDEAGRCREFTEWWMEKKAEPVAAG